MESTLEQYQKVYKILEDEQSRQIYLNRLNFSVSNDTRYIDTIVTLSLPNVSHIKKGTFQDLMASIPTDRSVVFYGAGTLGKTLCQSLKNDNRFIGFCSQTKEKQKNGYCGYPVMSPEELLARKELSVVISTHRADEEIKEILRAGNYPEHQIYSVNDLVYYEDPGQYFAPEFMSYEDGEVFLDVGCCDLNSSLELRKYCKSLKKVYAFEPDPENYKVCLERKLRHDFKQVELLPVGAWSKRTTLHFNAESNGTSCVSEAGSTSIKVVPIDEEIDVADRVTMIKMDIEGSELEALKGARRTIQRDKPKLAICIYHKPEDLTEIPLYIHGLVPEYKMYIRHHSSGTAETVLYAVMP